VRKSSSLGTALQARGPVLAGLPEAQRTEGRKDNF